MAVLRKLTAIMSIDVVGYSRLMEHDEAGTLAHLNESRRAIFNPRVEQAGGRIVKLMGDGALVEFSSIVSAVECALALQADMEKAESSVPEERRILYRIGVNLGDVIVEGDDIFGNGVNVAARIQGLADAGGIVVARAVRDHVAGRIPAEFQDRGEHAVKNIEHPVHIFSVHAPETETVTNADSRGAARTGDDRISICVLPFANMSGDPEQEYFSDGVTEDIITDLSKVSALSVVSRNTAFTFKGKSVDLAQTARHLKVTHILEGSVRKAGKRVRITAQLIDGIHDSHIWAERYDRDLDDIFALQDEIAESIVAALKLKLMPSEKKAIETRQTSNTEAYKFYLMARQYSLMANSRHRDIIVRLCRRALELDPNYAKAWALLAISLSNLLVLNARPGDNGWDAAEKALSLEPDLAEAHAARGRVMGDAGRLDEALAEFETALKLDPDSYDVNAAAARGLLSARRFADAARCLEKASRLAENDFWSTGMAVQCYRGMGDREGERSAALRTLERVEKVVAVEPDHGNAISFGVTALVTLGEKERALDWAERAILLDPDNTNLRYNLGCSLIQLGEIERGLDFIEYVIARSQTQGINWLLLDNDLDPVKDHPRFKAAVAAAKARNAQESPGPGV